MLTDKRILVTGLVTNDSIAFAVADRALQAGAEVVLTALPRDRRLAEQAAALLPQPVEILDFDATVADDVPRLTEALGQRFGGLDGALHAIAFAPREALAGEFLATGADHVSTAFHASAYSYAALARVLAALRPPHGSALVGLDFDAAGAWPVYNWMGVCKAALEAVNRYVARDLGPLDIRANLVAAGPLHTRAASGIPGFELLTDAWRDRAPLRWDPHDARPVADVACFLLSDHARAITGEIVHADAGYHAMAAPLAPAHHHDRGGPPA